MGYAHPVGDSYPSLEFLKICKNFGVKIVTVGSDTHSPSNLGFCIERGVEKLKKAGYDRIHLFNQRKPKELLL
jgi:histidinol-phosphatase (PHP family)